MSLILFITMNPTYRVSLHTYNKTLKSALTACVWNYVLFQFEHYFNLHHNLAITIIAGLRRKLSKAVECFHNRHDFVSTEVMFPLLAHFDHCHMLSKGTETTPRKTNNNKLLNSGWLVWDDNTLVTCCPTLKIPWQTLFCYKVYSRFRLWV